MAMSGDDEAVRVQVGLTEKRREIGAKSIEGVGTTCLPSECVRWIAAGALADTPTVARGVAISIGNSRTTLSRTLRCPEP